MAFTTEFVMGAGTDAKKYVVNWSDSGNNDTVVASFDAGESSLVFVEGVFSLASTSTGSRPHIVIGETGHSPTAAEVLAGVAFQASGQTDVIMRSRTSASSSFNGFITVFATEAWPRYAASNSSSETVDMPEGEWVTIDTHTTGSSGWAMLYYKPVPPNYSSGWESRVTLNGQDLLYVAPSTTGNASGATNSLGTDALALEVETGDVLSFSLVASDSSSSRRRLNSWSWSLS